MTPARGGIVQRGAKDLLCVFDADTLASGSTPGDVRQFGTRAALSGFRICSDFNAGNTGTQGAPCGKVHDVESLVLIEQAMTGHPANIGDWTDADWASYDTTCQAFVDVLVGTSRKDLKVHSDTADTIDTTGRRLSTAPCTPRPRT